MEEIIIEENQKELDNKNKMTEYEKLGLQKSLSIKGYKYSFKIKLKDNINFIYRYIHRKCGSQITIDKDNILKQLSNNKIELIQYKIGNNQHTCYEKKTLK